MPPFARPPCHLHRSSQPYSRPPSSSSSGHPHHPIKPKASQSRSESPVIPKGEMSDYSVAVDKKSKRKKKKRSERSRSLDKKATESELPEDMTATTSPAIPKVENQESIKNRYLSISAPSPKGSPGVLAPAAAQNKADSSPVLKPSSKKTAPLPMKHEDVVVKMMQKRLAKTESDAKKSGKEMTAKIEALEKEVAKQKATAEEQDKLIEGGTKMKEALKEAVQCGVCFETLNDPHILSCGHIACKDCLIGWFRTPGAYIHEIHEPLTPQVNTSYRSKVCHVCRSTIVRRPARVYHLRAILEPLGIDSNLPTASQEDLERDDPWRNLFPPEKDAYRLRDEVDGVSRCPECFGEIEEGMCGGCGIEFSASESDGDEGDWESGDGSIGDILDGEDLSATGSEAAIEDWDGGRMFPGRIIPGRPINGLPGRARRGRRGTPAGMVPRVERPRNRGGRELIDDIAARVPNEPNGHIFAEEDASDFEGSSDGNGHGGSFIDDGELSAGEEGGEDEEGGEPMEVDEDIVHAGGDSGDDDDDDDDPPIEELRRRRVARLGPPRARLAAEERVSTEVRHRPHRVRAIIDLGSDSDD